MGGGGEPGGRGAEGGGREFRGRIAVREGAEEAVEEALHRELKEGKVAFEFEAVVG